MRGQKGITLVALIITIIVLLILAVVAIGAVTDSKIIEHSENAAESYNSAKVFEDETLANAVNTMDAIIANTVNK